MVLSKHTQQLVLSSHEN